MATEEVIIRQSRRRYRWPEQQLNLWILVVLICAGYCVGVFANFMSIQTTMHLGTPWLFPYMVTVSAITLGFLALILLLASQRFLIPGLILLGSSGLFVLWLAGLIETSIQLYGSYRNGNVNGNCNSLQSFSGVSIETLAWLEQSTICATWRAAFGLEIVACVFFIWLIIMAWQVNLDE